MIPSTLNKRSCFLLAIATAPKGIFSLSAIISKPLSDIGPSIEYNARLRGWQRMTTKLKHNNCNHRGSMGLETPRVDSPS
ncbi:hypothetical protein FLL84_19135 [Vibrio cholerae]|nr:hypothetical protein FLL69_18085 [Vibrio cholerae]TQQ34249.1 hypothetical protein FLL84_19135 [Vibrio cholerae]TQQ54860.1 hypothetical protein FLL63_19625 [Vibrio cholerae]